MPVPPLTFKNPKLSQSTSILVGQNLKKFNKKLWNSRTNGSPTWGIGSGTTPILRLIEPKSPTDRGRRTFRTSQPSNFHSIQSQEPLMHCQNILSAHQNQSIAQARLKRYGRSTKENQVEVQLKTLFFFFISLLFFSWFCFSTCDSIFYWPFSNSYLGLCFSFIYLLRKGCLK